MSQSEKELHADWETDVRYLRTIAESMVKKHFGERCKTAEENCFCCARWKALDDLADNPYTGYRG